MLAVSGNVFSSISLGRCEVRVEPGPFKTLYEDNEIHDLTIT